jgi:hypothetical protein
MGKGLDERLHRGLCIALGCFLASLPAAAAVETPGVDKAIPSTSVTAKQAPGAKRDSSQADTGQPATVRQAPVKANAQEEPGQQSGGPSPEAQESYRAQMRELQERLEEVNVRAKTAKSGLIAIKSEMASQGLGLRSDVLEAEARMNHLIGKAQREISSGDAVSAEQDMNMAGYSIEFIERFLGR